MEQVLKKEKQIQAKPIMKWAGGKTQMLGDIMPKIPQNMESTSSHLLAAVRCFLH